MRSAKGWISTEPRWPDRVDGPDGAAPAQLVRDELARSWSRRRRARWRTEEWPPGRRARAPPRRSRGPRPDGCANCARPPIFARVSRRIAIVCPKHGRAMPSARPDHHARKELVVGRHRRQARPEPRIGLAPIEARHQPDAGPLQLADHVAQIVRGDADVAVGEDQHVVLRLRQHVDEVADLPVRPVQARIGHHGDMRVRMQAPQLLDGPAPGSPGRSRRTGIAPSRIVLLAESSTGCAAAPTRRRAAA
jgi:hypothetical protein